MVFAPELRFDEVRWASSSEVVTGHHNTGHPPLEVKLIGVIFRTGGLENVAAEAETEAKPDLAIPGYLRLASEELRVSRCLTRQSTTYDLTSCDLSCERRGITAISCRGNGLSLFNRSPEGKTVSFRLSGSQAKEKKSGHSRITHIPQITAINLATPIRTPTIGSEASDPRVSHSSSSISIEGSPSELGTTSAY